MVISIRHKRRKLYKHVVFAIRNGCSNSYYDLYGIVDDNVSDIHE
jgi:hypothetical protein